MIITLKYNEKIMVRVNKPSSTCIKNDFIVPVIMTNVGLMFYSDQVGVHVNPEEVLALPNMPLQCVLNQ